MTTTNPPRLGFHVTIDAIYLATALAFFVYLFHYYWTSDGGPTLLAFTLVPVTFVLFTLDSLRKDQLYPHFGRTVNCIIAVIYIAISLTVSIYMSVEFEEIGTVRAGSWDPLDIVLGGLMVLLIMEYARKRYFVMFILNIILIFYAVYGWLVPGMFYHPGLSWIRIVTSMSLEDTTGIFSDLPQLALTLIGSFILVLSVLRAFGCIDSILKGTSRIATHSPHALPQTAVMGSFAVAAVSGSGAANAITTGSATIPALISAGMPKENAAAIETASSLGGQLMPPIMGISAFLMANFLDVSYLEVVARGYVPALIYFIAVSVGVYLLSVRFGAKASDSKLPVMGWRDWVNIGAFLGVVIGLIIAMAVMHLPPMFAALYVFLSIGGLLLGRYILEMWYAHGIAGLKNLSKPLHRFIDNFTTMTADLTLLLATLSILTSAFINTGVPTKVGFIMVDAAAINITAMVLVAFLFGALLGSGLPPAPTYILTAIVIAPHMIKAGIDLWPVHFFAFFLAVWGELTPPTSVVAAITSKIAKASFLGTLGRSLLLCSSLFVLMAAMFTRPELVLKPGMAQMAAMGLVLVSTLGFTFSLQAKFSHNKPVDLAARIVLAAFSFLVLFHPDQYVAMVACLPVVAMIGYWVLKRRTVPVVASN